MGNTLQESLTKQLKDESAGQELNKAQKLQLQQKFGIIPPQFSEKEIQWLEAIYG